MKRLFFGLLIVALLAIPANAAFAQDFGDDFSVYDCDPMVALDNLSVTFTFASDLPSLGNALIYAGGYLATCIGEWLPLLINGLMGMVMGGAVMPAFPDTSTGIATSSGMTAFDAETALWAAFGGDIDTANAYLCLDDQISADDLTAIGDVTVESLSCYESGEGLITCDTTLTVGTGENANTFDDSTTFEIVDGLLCSLD